MLGETGGPVVTTLVCFLFFAREAAGAAGTRHSLRPLFSRERSCMNRARSAAGWWRCVFSLSPFLRRAVRGKLYIAELELVWESAGQAFAGISRWRFGDGGD